MRHRLVARFPWWPPGLVVAAISLVTNLAAGIVAERLSHDEVTDVATAARARFSTLLDALMPELAAGTDG